MSRLQFLTVKSFLPQGLWIRSLHRLQSVPAERPFRETMRLQFDLSSCYRTFNWFARSCIEKEKPRWSQWGGNGHQLCSECRFIKALGLAYLRAGSLERSPLAKAAASFLVVVGQPSEGSNPFPLRQYSLDLRVKAGCICKKAMLFVSVQDCRAGSSHSSPPSQRAERV